MLVTFTNPSATETVFVSNIYKYLAPLEAVSGVARTPEELRADEGLLDLIQTGQILLSYVLEAGDSVPFGFVPAPAPIQKSDVTRGAANLYPPYTCIWNTTDNALNWSDGAIWRDAVGAPT